MKPRISLIFNTCCLDPRAKDYRNPYRSTNYEDRANLLREVLKNLSGFDEVIVAGNFEEGENYHYIEVPPYYHDRRDALRQRELGARYTTGDLLVFSHDDHAPGGNLAYQLKDGIEGDIIVPKRINKSSSKTLNNGKSTDMMGGHLLIMRRWVWAKVPWTSVHTEWWDVTMTRLWREAGAEIMWNDDLICYDVEAKADET